MLNHLSTEEYLTAFYGICLLIAIGLILRLASRSSAPSGMTITGGMTRMKFRFRPGTWAVGAMQVWAMYWTCLYRGMDAFIVEWRLSKRDLMQEILKCEED